MEAFLRDGPKKVKVDLSEAILARRCLALTSIVFETGGRSRYNPGIMLWAFL